jgi:hypothetical protein
MRPLSEMLADMSVKAKAVEDKAAAAQQETHQQVSARVDAAKADAQRRQDAAKTRTTDAEHDISARWASLQAGVRNQLDDIHGSIQERRDAHDAKVAQRRADRAEENAAEAIEFAMSAIDEADESVLEAIDARLVANSAAV